MNSSISNKYYKILIILIIISVIIRAFLSFLLELTNDEVNYWLYAMYPGTSYYEHPPMVGLFIQLTSLNLMIDNEFFLRLSSVLLGAVNTYIIFNIGKKIKDELTGIYAAIMYNCSLYLFIISGVFIQPDTPLVFFWLSGMYFLVDGIFLKRDAKFSKSFLYAGLFIGLGMISKYTAAFMWSSAFLYIIIYNRTLLKRFELYTGVLISVICLFPVFYWNIHNEFKSVSFWNVNANFFGTGIRFDLFGTELSGQIIYNNPVVLILIIISIFSLSRIYLRDNDIKKYLLLSGLLLPIIFIVMSFIARTLPHWSGPGYIALILLAASYMSDKYSATKKIFPLPLTGAIAVSAIIILTGILHVNYGLLNFNQVKTENPEDLGKNDVTLDMYGWKQAGEKFRIINDDMINNEIMQMDAPIFSDKWYNSGHIDYYLARPLNKVVFAVGNLSEIRNYNWVNIKRGGYKNVKEAYYISPSRDYTPPYKYCIPQFSIIVPVDTIRIERNGKHVENMFVFIMKK